MFNSSPERKSFYAHLRLARGPPLYGYATLDDWDGEGTDADCVDDDSVDDEDDSLIDVSADKPQEYREVHSNPTRIEHFPDSYEAGKAFQDFEFKERSPNVNYLYPFLGSRDYKLARFFIESRVPKGRIDQFFKDEILHPASATERQDISFKSGHTLHKQTTKMIADPPWLTGDVEFPLRPKSEFKYREILSCIKYLLRHRAFVNHMLWEPVKVFNEFGEQEYSEMNSGTWWWEQQVYDSLIVMILSFTPYSSRLTSALHSFLYSLPPTKPISPIFRETKGYGQSI